MSYAVVLNPPKKKLPAYGPHLPPQKKFAAKMGEIGHLYRQVKSGNIPSWQHFVQSTVRGAKFNPLGDWLSAPVIGTGVAFGLSNWLLLSFLEKKVRITSWKDWVTSAKYAQEPKTVMKNYYGRQIATTLGVGSASTTIGYLTARYAQKTGLGKVVDAKGILLGGIISTLIKVGSRSIDLYKCWDYNLIHLAAKESKKWAMEDNNYFGKEFADKVAILKNLPDTHSSYSDVSANTVETTTTTTVDNSGGEPTDTGEQSNNVGGYIHGQSSHVNGYIYGQNPSYVGGYIYN